MTWCPHVTVATVVEQDGRFLLVEEHAGDELVFNQPAGHLDPDTGVFDDELRADFGGGGPRRGRLETADVEVAVLAFDLDLDIADWMHPAPLGNGGGFVGHCRVLRMPGGDARGGARHGLSSEDREWSATFRTAQEQAVQRRAAERRGDVARE